MSTTLTLHPKDLYRKGANEERVIVVDWDVLNLASGAGIIDSVWTIQAFHPKTESPVSLTYDNDDVLSGDRKTTVRLLNGVLGSVYLVTNTIRTNETPDQTKSVSFLTSIEVR